MNDFTSRPAPSRPTWIAIAQDGSPCLLGATRGCQPNRLLVWSSISLQKAALCFRGSGGGGSGPDLNQLVMVSTTNVTVPIVPPIAPIHWKTKGTGGITITSICSGPGTGRGAGDASGSGSGAAAIARGAIWHQTCSRNEYLNKFIVNYRVVCDLGGIWYAQSTGVSRAKALAEDGNEEKHRNPECQMGSRHLLKFGSALRSYKTRRANP